LTAFSDPLFSGAVLGHTTNDAQQANTVVDVVRFGDGVNGTRDGVLGLLKALDATFGGWAADLGAQERRYPILLPTTVLGRTDYYVSFPSQATFAAAADRAVHGTLRAAVADHSLAAHLQAPRWQLRPALCFHVYAELEHAQVGRAPTMITVTGPCFRHEAETQALERQREFTMREIVVVGEPDAVTRLRVAVRERTLQFAYSLGLDCSVDVANDPFFGSAGGKARALYQQAKELKWELVQRGCRRERSLAIASFNLHEDYFARAFDIRLAERDTPAWTGCFAFGLERWVAAVLDTHGPDAERWPDAVRALVARVTPSPPPTSEDGRRPSWS
jgi:seryl-tRNA synthetase